VAVAGGMGKGAKTQCAYAKVPRYPLGQRQNNTRLRRACNGYVSLWISRDATVCAVLGRRHILLTHFVGWTTTVTRMHCYRTDTQVLKFGGQDSV